MSVASKVRLLLACPAFLGRQLLHFLCLAEERRTIMVVVNDQSEIRREKKKTNTPTT